MPWCKMSRRNTLSVGTKWKLGNCFFIPIMSRFGQGDERVSWIFQYIMIKKSQICYTKKTKHLPYRRPYATQITFLKRSTPRGIFPENIYCCMSYFLRSNWKRMPCHTNLFGVLMSVLFTLVFFFNIFFRITTFKLLGFITDVPRLLSRETLMVSCRQIQWLGYNILNKLIENTG